MIGPTVEGGEYFHAHTPEAPADLTTSILPELPIIQTSDHWHQALDSALGPALKRAWEEEG